MVSCRLALLFSATFNLAASDSTFRLFAWYLAVIPLSVWLRLFVLALTQPHVDTRATAVQPKEDVVSIVHFIVASEYFMGWYLFPGECNGQSRLGA